MSARKTQQFGSDNYAGICPEVMQAIAEANSHHAGSYGADEVTQAACDKIREFFGTDCEVFFVFNGTAANALALSSLCQGYNSIICQRQAHVDVDECGAPEFFTPGVKLLSALGENGKLRPEDVEQLANVDAGNFHSHKPGALTLTQATECGTVYTPNELSALTSAARTFGLRTHMDGARFANALASLECSPADITWKAGIDVLSLGGTKNGLGLGEAVVFFNTEFAKDFEWRCKQAGQLCSKMRVLSSQWIGILDNEIWKKNAQHANSMALRLADGICTTANTTLNYPVEANAVFVDLDETIVEQLHALGWHFYHFPGAGSRLMCAWDTLPETVDDFLSDLKNCLDRD